MPVLPGSDDVSPPDKLWGMASWLVGHVHGDSRQLVKEAFGNSTGRTDLAVLAGLDQYGPVSQADLGRRLGINLGDLVSVLKRLEIDGSVAREQNAKDRRRNSIEITESGRAKLEVLEAAALSAQDQLLDSLSTAEREQLVRLLQKIVETRYGYDRGNK